MREDLLKELENEYEQIRSMNAQTESARKEKIRTEYPEIHSLMLERENLVFGTLKEIMKGTADTGSLPERMRSLSEQIRVKLEDNGFPADYLSPVYRCPVCRDTGKTGDLIKEPCACVIADFTADLPEGCRMVGTATNDSQTPAAASVARIAAERQGEKEIAPLYLKLSQAERLWKA